MNAYGRCHPECSSILALSALDLAHVYRDILFNAHSCCHGVGCRHHFDSSTSTLHSCKYNIYVRVCRGVHAMLTSTHACCVHAVHMCTSSAYHCVILLTEDVVCVCVYVCTAPWQQLRKCTRRSAEKFMKSANYAHVRMHLLALYT